MGTSGNEADRPRRASNNTANEIAQSCIPTVSEAVYTCVLDFNYSVVSQWV